MCVVEFARNYVFSVGISQLSEGGGGRFEASWSPASYI